MLEEGYQLYLNQLAVGDVKASSDRKVIDKVEVQSHVYLCLSLFSLLMMFYAGGYREETASSA